EGREQVLSRAYGMADLEHNVTNTTETVFEPGSVSKQFTAAATILLALDGELSLDDDIRQYIPELPDYGHVITIRHLLNHTSGLRDWGSVAGIGGWPRTTRVHTHVHVLDIAKRQRSLNYPPGEYYSYTNSGYNLQAILVERVSGMSFAEFSQKRIFEPLGMTRTEWRDDFTRVVKDRAIAYSPTAEGGYRMNMPFENVHGNGGLLTTVGDLLRFTYNLETGELGGPEFLREMHTQGVLSSGRTIAYASGLFVGEYKGVREVQHSGGTAGYRGFLTRFPDQGVAVAVMCNASNGNAGRLAHEVADLYLGDALVEEAEEAPPEPGIEVAAAEFEALAGVYRRARDRRAYTISWTDGVLRLGGQRLVPVSETRLVLSGTGLVLELGAASGSSRPAMTVTMPDGDVLHWEPVPDSDPSPEELAEYVGEYFSDEAEVTYTFEVRDGALVRVDRYGEISPLRPVYVDAYSGRGGLYIFNRQAGQIESVSLVQGRVWDIRFSRVR
ncbi:MAG: beta-lactamase family protein, partial [Gemmatimonadota bacterium]